MEEAIKYLERDERQEATKALALQKGKEAATHIDNDDSAAQNLASLRRALSSIRILLASNPAGDISKNRGF